MAVTFRIIVRLWLTGVISHSVIAAQSVENFLLDQPTLTLLQEELSGQQAKEHGEGDSGTSATTSDTEIAGNTHQPEGWRDGIDLFVAPPPRCTRPRVVVASRTRRRRARHKRLGIPGTRH